MLSDQTWIHFRYVDQLTVNGGGTLDGQGTATRQKYYGFGLHKQRSPTDNRKTDGIKISHTNGINITSVHIGTGDDCVAMICGTKKVRITDVFCGPGHGISVGSLGGGNPEEIPVEDVVVKSCTFNGSSNGVQIKTWPVPLNTPFTVSGFTYEDITMINVQHPIVINRQYCPEHNCDLTVRFCF
ncbi:unnamed protein product [Sphenostylis stenocarpa]|uniref:Polygalacturonase n=1 Tax=Sphenostylis stenocarpa TaxID=92480 RepID=A0AA86SKQ1_9FABA|nr:unnamed protein product [Sphenostylis stenocarpa]